MTTGQIAGLTVTAGGLAYAVTALAFLVLLALLVVGWRRGGLGVWLIAATVITLVWAAVIAYDFQTAAGLVREVAVLEALRSAGWLAFLLKFLFVTWPASWSPATRRALWALLGVTLAGLIGVAYADVLIPGVAVRADLGTIALAGFLALAVSGLLLTENLFRNSDREQRWRLKFLCFALAGMFAFDFIIYAEATLFHRLNGGLYSARGLAIALTVPLIAVSTSRNRDWTGDMSVSRQVVFHSTTLIGSGVYLLLMAGAGYYVRQFGGQWGPAVQASFLFAAVLFLAVTVASTGFRSRVWVFINKHFFSYKYDYRSEWLRFISTMSSPETSSDLSERAVSAVADIMDSPEAELWLRGEDDIFTQEVAWNRPASERARKLSPQLVRFLEISQWVVDLTHPGQLPEEFADVEFPEWLTASQRAWLVVPLLHDRRLAAFIIVGQPRSPRRLNWEDFDLLKTVGRQVASYLAAQTAARLLAESQQFDEFNRRFAFVVHDIKNLVSQLSLMLSNAGKFKDNPEFQEDMLVTVRGSVEKMNGMLFRLHEGGKESASQRLDLREFLESRVAGNSRGDGTNLTCEHLESGISIDTNMEKLASVLDHLIDNALDAIEPGGRVVVRLTAEGPNAVIEVADDGAGMSREFLENELFRPFRSTKRDGFGIGAYESRQIVRDLGGQMLVDSVAGKGTTFRIVLPRDGTASEIPGAAAQ